MGYSSPCVRRHTAAEEPGERGRWKGDGAENAGHELASSRSRACAPWGLCGPLCPPRRHPGARRHGRDPLPRLPVMGDRRVLRRRPFLRSLGLPDHVPPSGRVAAQRRDRPPGVLGPPGPATPAGALLDAGRRGSRGRSLPTGAGLPRPLRRHPGDARVCGELALHRRTHGLLRDRVQSLTAPAHLDARHRGTVLPGVAARPVGHLLGGAPPSQPAWHRRRPGHGRGGRRHRRRRLRPPDGRPHADRRHLGDPGLLRERYPRPGPPGRVRAGGRLRRRGARSARPVAGARSR